MALPQPSSFLHHLFKRSLNRFNRSPLTDFGSAKGPRRIKERATTQPAAIPPVRSSSRRELRVRFVTAANDVAKTTGGTRENAAGQGD